MTLDEKVNTFVSLPHATNTSKFYSPEKSNESFRIKLDHNNSDYNVEPQNMFKLNMNSVFINCKANLSSISRSIEK